MLTSLTTLFAALSSVFRFAFCPPVGERGATPPNQRASTHREKTPEIDAWGPPVVGLAVAHLERLALGAGHRPARNRHCLASRRLSPVLDLEGARRPSGTTGHFARGSRSDPPDVSGESELGCTPRSR